MKVRSARQVLMVANEKAWADWSGQSTSRLIGKRPRAALGLLWRSYVCAQATGTNLRDLAVRAGKLCEAGMTGEDLRWLIAKGFARLAAGTPVYDEAHPAFPSRNDDLLNEHTGLILTPRGAALAEHLFRGTTQLPGAWSTVAAVADEAAAADSAHAGYENNLPAIPALKPSWSATRRELSLAGLIVKRFRVPARNQETILSVFEEEGWAEHIHDPLPVTYEIDAPTRLHDAINRLNRCQINQLLRFHGDGKGTGVLWELNQPNLWMNRRGDSL